MPTANGATNPYQDNSSANTNTNNNSTSWVDEWNLILKEQKDLEEKRKKEDKLRLKLKRKDLFDRKKQQRRLG